MNTFAAAIAVLAMVPGGTTSYAGAKAVNDLDPPAIRVTPGMTVGDVLDAIDRRAEETRPVLDCVASKGEVELIESLDGIERSVAKEHRAGLVDENLACVEAFETSYRRALLDACKKTDCGELHDYGCRAVLVHGSHSGIDAAAMASCGIRWAK